MSRGEPEHQQAHREAIDRLTELRTLAKNSLAEAEMGGVPGARTIANDTPPTKDSRYGSNSYRKPKWVDRAQQLHASTLSYWSEVRPYRTEAPGLWGETLAEVERPVPADTWRKTKPTGKLPRRYRGVEYITRPLSLETLGRWRSKSVTLECHVEQRHGEDIRRTRDEDVFLPLLGASLVVETLDDVLSTLGLLAEVETAGDDGDSPGINPEDIR